MMMQMLRFHSFIWPSNIPLYICTTAFLFTHLLMGTWIASPDNYVITKYKEYLMFHLKSLNITVNAFVFKIETADTGIISSSRIWPCFSYFNTHSGNA